MVPEKKEEEEEVASPLSFSYASRFKWEITKERLELCYGLKGLSIHKIATKRT